MFFSAGAGDSEVVMCGTGAPRREFLHVNDLAHAAVFLINHYNGEDIVNVGEGKDLSIRELTGPVREVVGFEGAIRNDTRKPDSTPRKLRDVSRLHALGWEARIPLREGIRETYRWLVGHRGELRA